MATMITGRPTIRKEGNPNTLLHDSTIFGDPKAWLQLPRNDVIHVNLSVDVANFRNGSRESREKFPRTASNRKRPSRNTASELLL